MEQNKKPLVTIVLPVYNGEKYLQETINSVLKQTFSDFDFLILDDVSTDKSVEVIKSFSDPRIKFVRNETNLGSVGTPEKGMEMSNTKYIARIDQDDIWLPSKLEKQIKIMEADDSVGICGTSIELFGDRSGIKIFPVTTEPLKVGFLFFCMMSHPSVVFRKSFLEMTRIQYNKDYRLADDYKMWIDCIDLTQIYNIPEPLTKYRQHNEQICSPANAEKQAIVTRKVQLEVLKKIYPNVLPKEQEIHQTFIKLQFKTLQEYVQSKQWVGKLCAENDKSRYVDADILKKELQRYLKAGYKNYILNRYFQKKNFKSAWKYFLSCDWTELTIRQNAGLLLNCLK